MDAVIWPGKNFSASRFHSFDGASWGQIEQVPNAAGFLPSAAALPAGGISVFYQGAGNDGQLWFSYYDGTKWAPREQVPNVAMFGSPSAVVF